MKVLESRVSLVNRQWCDALVLVVFVLLHYPVLTMSKGASSGDKLEGGRQYFAMEPQDQTAIVGSRVTLPCRVVNKEGALQVTTFFISFIIFSPTTL